MAGTPSFFTYAPVESGDGVRGSQATPQNPLDSG